MIADFIMVLPMVSRTFNVLYKSTPGVMYKNVSAIVGGGKVTVPFVFLATYVSAESLAAIASEADRFEVVNIGLHSQMLATTLGFSNEIIVPVPLDVVIPLLTLQSLKQLALSHNVVDVFGCQKKQDILDVIRQHQKTCTCENVVTVFRKCAPRKKKGMEKPTGSQKSSAMETTSSSKFAVSVDLAPYLKEGILLCGEYDLERYDCMIELPCPKDIVYVACSPKILQRFASSLTLAMIACNHGLDPESNQDILFQHECTSICEQKLSMFKRRQIHEENKPLQEFPPPPLSPGLLKKIVHDFCSEFSAPNIEEAGCMVCGQLCLIKNMHSREQVHVDLSPLHSSFTRVERTASNQPITSLSGPILAPGCSHICSECLSSLKIGNKPPKSLANGFWLGTIPDVLKKLTFAEKVLVSRIRHNRCLVKVSSGRAKMIANVVMYSNPTAVVYNVLPPPLKDLDDVLAFLFVGSAPPTMQDFSRTPMLVRRNVVKEALECLTLNHVDYYDIQISTDNLKDYPLSGIPVQVISKLVSEEEGNVLASELSIHDNESEKGTNLGMCPFMVNGVTGKELNTMSAETMKAIALQHLKGLGKVLAIGHGSDPVSMYDNLQSCFLGSFHTG